MDSIFMRLNFSSLLSSITAELCSTSWGVWQGAPLSPLCFLWLLTCSFEPCLTYKHRSFVERTSGCFNLWQNGHTGTLMANHMITWGKQIRHEHARSHTHTHTHTQAYCCCKMKNMYLQDVSFSWAKKNCLGFIFFFFCFFQWGFESSVVQLSQPKEIISLIMSNNKKLELTCFHLTTTIYIYTHTHTSTDRSPSFSFFNYIFKPQQLDLFCLFECAGASWDSIYTHTPTHTQIYTDTMSITEALTWLGVTTGKHLRFFLLSVSVKLNLWSFGAFQSHHINNYSNITTLIFTYC